MTGLTVPGLGPLVGHVTHDTARIWVRAHRETDREIIDDANSRTLGVLAVLSEGDTRHGRGDAPCFYFRLRREFSRTGTITLGDAINAWKGKAFTLKPDTRYVLRVGVLTLDDPSPFFDSMDWSDLATRLPDVTAWEDDLRQLPAEEAEAAFFTFPEPKHKGRFKFLLGSCRYPGIDWKQRKSDEIFGPMAERSTRRDGARFALMVGDQIYADTLNRFIPIGRADTFEEFEERYVSAYGSPNMRRLLRHTPTYMILDDHEIEDNWDTERLKKDGGHRLFTLATDAYMSYQWSHGPRSFGKRFYYQFDYGTFPFFVLDTRTQRYFAGDSKVMKNRHMLGAPTRPGVPPGQLVRLLDWLGTMQKQRKNVPKFVVSPAVFVPSPVSAAEGRASDAEKIASDSWPAFIETKRAILRYIVDNQIQNVVFLSGDIHCANISQIRFDGSAKARKLKTFAVTSSAFYWPFPFADGEPSEFMHDSEAEDGPDTFEVDPDAGIKMDYVTDSFTQDDNFAQITVDAAAQSMRVEFFNKKGTIVEEEEWMGLFKPPRKTKLSKVLKFAAF